MKRYDIQRLLLGVVLGTASTVCVAQDCPKSNLSSMCLAMRAQDAQDQADKALNAAYQRVLHRMSGPKGEYIDYPKLKAEFVEAQRQWVHFRDAECDAWYLVNEAGTDRNVDLMDCLINRTKDRTQELNEWAAYLP